MRVKAALRIAVLAAIALPLIPVQMAALRFGWRLQGNLPAMFHRLALAVMGVRVTVRGAPDRRRPLLVTANHASWLDIVILGSLTPLSFVAKSEVAGWPVIGLFAKLQRSIFIERQRRQQTGQAAQQIGARLSAGDIIVLFAEGTTGDGIRILPFRTALIGAARHAMGTDDMPVAVQPLAITYARRAGLPIGRAAMPEIAWHGDMDLAPHLLGILGGEPIDIVVTWGEAAIYDAGTDRKALTRTLEADVRRMAKDHSF